MTTHLDTSYVVRTFFCKENRIQQFAFWQEIMTIIGPLLEQSGFKAEVVPSVFDTRKKDWLQFGELQFTEADLSKWTVREQAETSLNVERVEVFVPSIHESNTKKITPAIMIKASVKAAPDEDRYESLFTLFVQEALLKKITARQADEIWKGIHNYLQPVFVAGATIPWAVKKSELQYGETLQHFFPSVVLASGNQFVFREGYDDWKQL